MKPRLFLLFLVPLAFLLMPLLSQAQWPDRHGPAGTSYANPEDTKGLPIHWGPEKNIAWKAELHDEGHSGPVVMDGRVWLTAASKDGKKQWVLCFDEDTGEKVHDIMLFENLEPESLGGAKGYNNYAAPTCVLEPGAAYVHFGSYGTTKLDAASGDVIWARRDLPCRHYRGPGSSPILVDGKLILTFDGVDQQYTAALDAETGKTLWRTDRSTDYGDLGPDGKPLREGDLRKAYCTPGVAVVEGKKQLMSVGSRAMQSYDLETGREIWTVRHGNYNAAIKPMWLEKEGLAIINTGSRGAHFLGVKLDKTTVGDVTESHVVWDRPRGNPRFAKPVYHDGLLTFVNDTGVAVCLDAATGKEHWKDRVRGNYRGSPFFANGHIYFFSESGRGTVIKAGEVFEEVAVNNVPEMGTTSCPAVSKGAIFVRGKTQLFKIASTP